MNVNKQKLKIRVFVFLSALLVILYCTVQSLPFPTYAEVNPQPSDTYNNVFAVPQPNSTRLARSFDAPPAQAATPTAIVKLFLPLLFGGSSGVLPTPTATPVVGPTTSPSGNEWSQHAHDAQRTGYTDQVVPTPWRWKWAWNGPNASGAVSAGKFSLPRNSQPVTGGGRVYIAAGANGVYALNNANGAVVWNRNPGGSINSTPAYDSTTNAVFVLSSNGTLYKLDAANGNTLAQFATGASSTLPLPPALLSDRVIISMGNRVYAINKTTMAQIWTYDAGSAVHTPPAYSPSRNRVIVASQDLYVHAINNSNGSQAWRKKPTVRQPGDPGDQSNFAEVKNGWPVIAEVHGLVLIRYRLDWQTLWTWSPWPGTNAEMRANLTNRPDQQAVFALSLDTGASAFVANVGNGGFGDGGYLPIGPQPVVKKFANGQEVAYVVSRAAPCAVTPCDGRADSHLAEMMLDANTVAGYQAGDVRFMRDAFFPTDEQPFLTVSGDMILGGHWAFGFAHQITDRSASKGAISNPIVTTDLPHIAVADNHGTFTASHYYSDKTCAENCGRVFPPGFFIYYTSAPVYDQYWSEYAVWVVSNNTIYFVSTDGAVVALENGNPTAMPATAATPVAHAPTDLSHNATLLSALAPTNPNAVIPFEKTWNYAGQVTTVEMPIRYLFNNYVAVYLGATNPHQGAFKARILKKDWGAFGAPPETLFRVGQTIRVTGRITWYQGDPVIYITDPAQIQVVDP